MPTRKISQGTYYAVILVVILGIFFLTYTGVSLTSSSSMTEEELTQYRALERNCSIVRPRNRTWPKILHQIWLKGDIPDKYKPFVEGCKLLNPDYEYRVWCDKDMQDLIDRHYSWFSETYTSYPYWVQKMDAGRLFLMYHYGGTCLDVDIKCKVPLSSIHRNLPVGNHSVILARAEPVGIKSCMQIAKPHDPFYQFMTRRLLKTKGTYLSPHWTVMLSAGPIFVFKSFLRYPCKNHVQLISTFDHDSVYFTHEQAATWHNWDGPFIRWFDIHGRSVLNILAFVGLLAILRGCFVLKKLYSRRMGAYRIANSNS